MSLLVGGDLFAQLDRKASEDLIRRVVPKHAAKFRVEYLPGAGEGDVFEIRSENDKIVLRGNNGVAIASALYHYIRNFTQGQITWNGTNLELPKSLPAVTIPVRKTSPYEYRYYLNYCTFNYSMSWWDWSRWEQEIDWMALHGINMPLAITGQEAIWYEVYKELGFSKHDLDHFFSGPAYFAWFWMGNLDGWGGPLPARWMQTHKELQHKILRRQRQLGMKPVLPAFTGHVPASFTRYFPNAKLKKTNWGNGFGDTYILDANDPLFTEISRRFLEKQRQVYGTDHLYSADTFNENEPPSDDPAFLSDLSRKVYDGMKSADPEATWVMQGWLFYSDREFWRPAQIRALLDAVPDDHMIILDLAAEIEPVWKRTDAFYGKPWIWNMLHNFGGNVNMFGRMDLVAAAPAEAKRDPHAGKMKGIGLTMEGIEQNPVLYELMTDHIWDDQPVVLEDWLTRYVAQRYGCAANSALTAWNILRQTVYNGQDIRDGAESIISARPTLDSHRRWVATRLNYRPEQLLRGWDELMTAIPDCKPTEGFRYDLVDVSRQVLANYALTLHKKFVTAYREKDTAQFNVHTKLFLNLMDDLDWLLASRKEFLLGAWVESAKACGKSRAEQALYEINAKNLITLWGDRNNRLHEYACRQWNGLIGDFYKPRWEQFFTVLQTAMETGREPDLAVFEERIKDWEWNWVNASKSYARTAGEDELHRVKQIYNKYRNVIAASYE